MKSVLRAHHSTGPKVPLRYYSSTLLHKSENDLAKNSAQDHGATRRLRQVKSILNSPRQSSKVPRQCYELYKNEGGNLFSDVMRSPQKLNLLETFCAKSVKSRPTKAFLLDQLFQCSMNSDFGSFTAALNSDACAKLLHRPIQFASDLETPTPVNRQSHYCSVVVSMALNNGEPILAASFALKMAKASLSLQDTTFQQMLMDLSMNHPAMNNYHAYTIFRLLEAFKGKISVNRNVLFSVVQNMAENRDPPLFANILYDRLHESSAINQQKEVNQEDSEVSPQFVNASKALIVANLDHGNSHRAADIWINLYRQDAAFGRQNVKLFRQIIEISDEDTARNLLKEGFNESLYGDPDFVDFGLSFFGQRREFHANFQELVKTLKPPLQRTTLSSLFSALLVQNEEKPAERILQTIFSTKSGLNSADFDVITKKLLSQHKIGKCISMSGPKTFDVTWKGDLRILAYILAHPALPTVADLPHDIYQQVKPDFLQSLIGGLRKRRTNNLPILRQFTVTILKDLTHRISIGAGRRLYTDFAHHNFRTGRASFDIQRYGYPAEFERFLHIDHHNRLECLQILIDEARRQQDDFLLKWAIGQVQENGVCAKDVKKYFLK